MGLFDFVKDMGESLFTSDAEAAEKIKERIEYNNPGVINLEVKVEDSVAHLTGGAKDRETLEKVVLIAGNVQGIESVDASCLECPEDQSNVKYYTIVSGDSLSKIAKEFYGDAMQYPRIFEANREVIKDADLIYPGQKIRIPMD